MIKTITVGVGKNSLPGATHGIYLVLNYIYNVINDLIINHATVEDVYSIFDVLSQTFGHGNRRSSVHGPVPWSETWLKLAEKHCSG